MAISGTVADGLGVGVVVDVGVTVFVGNGDREVFGGVLVVVGIRVGKLAGLVMFSGEHALIRLMTTRKGRNKNRR